jgi:hypothetical protein
MSLLLQEDLFVGYIVALPTFEVEYIAVSHAYNETIWLKGLLGEFGDY